MSIFETILHLTDASVPFLLSMQQDDPSLRDYNGQMSPGKGFAEPSASNYVAATLIAVYFCPESKYYHSEKLLECATNLLIFLLSSCNEDGTLDLMETNFHDCTCNGFAVQTLAYTYRLLEREAKTSNEIKVKDLTLEFIQTSADAMLHGGFHTPNHRWVLASALSLCSNILNNRVYSDMANVYLSEDIDQNDEGDYTERSIGVYDAICNESLIIIAQELNLPELFVFVENNISKNLFFIEPDFSALTLASTRQDYGKDMPMVRHFLSALLLFRHNGNENALYLSRELLKQMNDIELRAGPPMLINNTLSHNNILTRLLLEPSLSEPLPSGKIPSMRYEKTFESTGIVRYRYDDFTLTLTRDNSTFLKVQNGHLKAYIKLTGSFFARGKMQTQTITKIDGGYRCLYQVEWGYIRPIENLHEKNWHKINHNNREKTNMQKLIYQIDVLPLKAGVKLHITSDGTPNIPIKLEFIFDEDGMLFTKHTTQSGISGGYSIVGESFSYERYGEKMIIDGGFNLHDYAPNMRGSDPMPQSSYCVFFTGFTPIDSNIVITAPPFSLL